MKKNLLKYWLMLAVVVVAIILSRSCFSSYEPAPAQVASKNPVHVEIGIVEEKTVPRYLLLTGELKAEKESSVATDTAGIIVFTPIERGMAVKKGDILVRLDDRDAVLAVHEAEAKLNSAKAEFNRAQKDLERNTELAKAKIVSASVLEQADADNNTTAAALSVAKVSLDKAKKNLADCTVYAPLAGFVTERKVQIGEYVQTGAVIAHLVEVNVLRLSLNVPETAVGNISNGQKVFFTVGAYPDKIFSGKVRYVGSLVRATSRDLVIEAEVANADGRLKPGMFASAQLEVDSALRTVLPKNALRANGNSFHVFVVQDGHLVEKLVEPGVSVEPWVEVRGGLHAGEKIVLSPADDLKDGAPVLSN